MLHAETMLERTDRMLRVMDAGPASLGEAALPARDMASLWKSGLNSSQLLSVGEPALDAQAEKEAQSIIDRHLERQHHQPLQTSMSGLVDFQNELQMRSKVITAIEMLSRG
jgi:hypothetical protein